MNTASFLCTAVDNVYNILAFVGLQNDQRKTSPSRKGKLYSENTSAVAEYCTL